jgi:hypothetical protein
VKPNRTITTIKRLTLTRQTLRTPTPEQLRQVSGGRRSQCTYQESGCIN